MNQQHSWNHAVEAGSLSVVVPCHTADYGLEKCLQALAALRIPGVGVEVLVANHGCRSGIADLCAKYGIVDIPVEEGGGSYKARNEAILRSRGEWIAFTDSNKFPAPDWALRGVELLSRRPSAIVAGPVSIVPHPERGEDDAFLVQLYQAFPIHRYVRESGYGVTGNLFVPRAVFERAGLFDAETQSGGDREFCMRAARFGFEVVFDPAPVVGHFARSESELRVKRARTFAGIVGTWENAGGDRKASWPWKAIAKYWFLPPRRIADNPIPDRWNRMGCRWVVLRRTLRDRLLLGWRILRLKLTGAIPEGSWY